MTHEAEGRSQLIQAISTASFPMTCVTIPRIHSERGISPPHGDKLAPPGEWLGRSPTGSMTLARRAGSAGIPALWGVDAVARAQQHPGRHDISHNIGWRRRDSRAIRACEITAPSRCGSPGSTGRFPPRPPWRVMPAGDEPTRATPESPLGASIRRRHGEGVAGHARHAPVSRRRHT